MQTLGSRLKSILKHKGLSNYALAKGTGLSESAIGRIVKDQTTPTEATLEVIADHLKITVDWLQNGEGAIFAIDEEKKKEWEEMPENNTTIDRVYKILKHFNIPNSDASSYVGASLLSLVQTKKRGDGLSESQIRSILSNFPDVDPDWLLTGKGTMLKRLATEQQHLKKVKTPNVFDLEDGDRLFRYFDFKGFSVQDVSSFINIPVSKLEAIRNGEELIDVNLGFHISRSYPDLNYGWVQSGEGSMILSAAEIKKQRELREFIEGKSLSVVHSSYLTEIRKFADKFLIVAPMVGEFDMNEYVGTWGTKYYPEISQFAVCVDSITLGNYLSVYVYDDSMDDGSSRSIPRQSIALGKEIDQQDWTHKSVLNKYKTFIIHAKSGVFIKNVTGYDPGRNALNCESYHPDKTLYPNIDLSLNEIREIFNIEVITRTI